MKTNDKNTHILNDKPNAMLSGLKIMFQPEIDQDNYFFIEVTLEAFIKQLEYKKGIFKNLLDKAQSGQTSEAQEAGYANAGTAKKAMENMEIYSQNQSRTDWKVQQQQTNVDYFDSQITVLKSYYKQVLNKEYIPYSKSKYNKERYASKVQEAIDWNKAHQNELEPIIA